MCGIVGYIGPRNLTNVIMVGLERLEYRGYDSCGIATVDGGLTIRKTAGRLQKLKEILAEQPGDRQRRGRPHALGDPRQGDRRERAPVRRLHRHASPWSTTASSRTTASCASGWSGKATSSSPGTDTEIIVHLIESYYKKRPRTSPCARPRPNSWGPTPSPWYRPTEPDRLFAVKTGSPLVIGQGEREYVIASDAPALVGIARQMLPMQDGEIAVVYARRVGADRPRRASRSQRPFVAIDLKAKAITKGRYPHFMRKEIYEQPQVIEEGIEHRFRDRQRDARPGVPALPGRRREGRAGRHPGLRHVVPRRARRAATTSRSSAASRSRSKSARSCARPSSSTTANT